MLHILKYRLLFVCMVLAALGAKAQTSNNAIYITQEHVIDTTQAYYMQDTYVPKLITLANTVKDTLINNIKYKKIKCTEFVKSTGPKKYYTVYEHGSAGLLSVLDAKFNTIHHVKLVTDTVNPGTLFGKSGNIKIKAKRDYNSKKPGKQYAAHIKLDGDTLNELAFSLDDYSIIETTSGNTEVKYNSGPNIDNIINGLNYKGKPIKISYNNLKINDYVVFKFEKLGSLMGSANSDMLIKITYVGDTIIDGNKTYRLDMIMSDGLKTVMRNSLGRNDIGYETDSSYNFSRFASFPKTDLEPYIGIDSVTVENFKYEDYEDDYAAPPAETTPAKKAQISYRGLSNDTINGKLYPKIVATYKNLYSYGRNSFKDAFFICSYFPIDLPTTMSNLGLSVKPIAVKIGGVEAGTPFDFDNTIQEYQGDDEKVNKEEWEKDRMRADSLASLELMTNPLIVNEDNKNKFANYLESVELKKKNLVVKLYLTEAADVTIGIQNTPTYNYYNNFDDYATPITTTGGKNLTAGWQTFELPAGNLLGDKTYHVYAKYNKPGVTDSIKTIAVVYYNPATQSGKNKHKVPKATAKAIAKGNYISKITLTKKDEIEVEINAPEDGVMLYSIKSSLYGTANTMAQNTKVVKGPQKITLAVENSMEENVTYSLSMVVVGKKQNFSTDTSFEYKQGMEIIPAR